MSKAVGHNYTVKITTDSNLVFERDIDDCVNEYYAIVECLNDWKLQAHNSSIIKIEIEEV